VYAIRRALGSDVILLTGPELRLNPERIRADVWEFEDAIRAHQWTAAVGLYTGTLLDGFHCDASREFEAWIDAERARALREYQTAIESLADRCVEVGDHSQLVAWRHRLVSSDPLSAGATKKLMLALAAAGDRAGAVKQARQYQALVRRELEIEPDAEVEALVSTLSQPSATAPVAPPVTPRAVPLRPYPRMERSRNGALATLAVMAMLVLGALSVTDRRDNDVFGRRSRIPLPEAHEAYLRGINAWEDRTKEGLDSAIVHFRRAISLDPGYADAYAELAEAYVRIGYFGYRPADAMFPKAKAAARRSIRLDSTLASAHTALATELLWEHNFAGAESEYRKAISLDSMDATAHQWYSVLLMITGRVSRSLPEIRRAAELEPLSLQVQNNYGSFLNHAGDHPAALRQFQKTVADEPDSAWVRRNPWVLANMSRVYADNGQYADALRTMNRALAIVPRHPRALYTLAVIYDEMGRPDLAREAFARADESHEQYAAYRGMVYADQGNADSALFWYDRMATWGIQPMLTLQAERRIDPLRGDPRFRALLARLGVPQPPRQ
jgi:tetratricopeptide (TPR) repeat protein